MIDQQVKLDARPASEHFYKSNAESDLTQVKQWSERLSKSGHALITVAGMGPGRLPESR